MRTVGKEDSFAMSEITLSSIFNAHKEELGEKLKMYSLPKDSKEVETTVTKFLERMFENDGDYRQNLTQSEDYILQAAISLLNAQRALVSAFDVAPKINIESPKTNIIETKERLTSSKSVEPTKAFIGAGGGALIGNVILGGWGAVFGSIAGTAIALYLSQQSHSNQTTEYQIPEIPKVNITNTPVNVNLFLSVIEHICNSLDNLIETFRAQVKRVVNKYESQEKPTIEKDFRTLLEGIQTLIGYKRGHSPEEEKYLSKLQTRVEDLAELLDNYDLEAVDYTPEHTEWFEAIESNNANEIKMVTPAIIKNGTIVVKGKIFIPKH